MSDMISFDCWMTDEVEFINDAEYKFSELTHPVRMALGTHGKNDHLAKASVEILADWALHKLFVACAKVLWWTIRTIVKRTWFNAIRRLPRLP